MAEKSKRVVNRYFCAILYKEDANFEKYFKNINENYEEITYIIHDKDINEDGTPKKPHMHILFKVGNNARHLESIAKEIEIPPNYLQGCNKNNMLLYLIHYRNEDKTQYKLEEVKGDKNMIKKLKNLTKKEEETEEIIKDLINQIKRKSITKITSLVEYAIDNGIYEEIKRNQLILCKCIEETKQEDIREQQRKKEEEEKKQKMLKKYYNM